MQTAAASAAETGTLPSLLPLQAWSESAWDVSSGKIPSTVTSRSLQKRRYGGVRGLNIGVAALAAVVAVAAGFLVLRCAVYLRNASRSRGELRFLAEGRWSDESRGNPCHLPQERPPAGAAAAGEYEQVDEGPLAANDLLLKAKIYTGKLMEMVDGSQSVLWSLPPVLRARCLAALLVLLVVELAALFSLLERRERQVLEAGVHGMYGRIWDMRNSVENEDVTSSRQRHIRWLHITFGNLHEIDPTPERYPQRDWLMELHNLLQLQETALEQVKRGIAGLRQCVNSDRTNDDANPDDAAEDADVAGSSTPAAASDGATEERLDATVTAMVTTIHLRRNQVLSDPLLSEWLRMHHHGTHYALVRRQALQKLINQPLQAHSKLLGDLRSTPLGSGKEPWLGKKKENQPAFTRPQRSRENAYARPEDRRSAPASRQQHTFLRQGSHTGAGAVLRSDSGGSDGGRLAFSPPVSNADVDSARSAPTPIFSSTFPFVATAVSTSFTAPHHLGGFPEGSQTTTDATGSARTSPPPTTLVFNDDDIDADTAASERTRGPLQGKRRLKRVSLRDSSGELPHSASPAVSLIPRLSHRSATPRPADGSSVSDRHTGASSTSAAAAAAYGGASSPSSQLPGTSPRPQTSSFGAAATTAASSTHAPTVPTEGAAPPARLAQPRSASSWAAVAAGSTAPAAAGVDPVGLSSGSSQLPGTSPRSQTSSFGAAATTAASSTHAPTVPTEGAAPPARLAQPRSTSSWAAVAAGSTAPAAAGVDPVGLSSGSSQLPGTSPRPQTSSFGAAATTAASSTHAPTVPTEGAAPPARLAQPRSASSWAAVAAGSTAPAAAGVDPVGLLSGSSQLPGTSPRPQTSSFGAAATTAASSTHAPTVPTEGAAPPARLAQPRSASSWAAVAAGSTAPAAAGVDPVGLSSGSSQLPGTSPRPQTSSFGAAATTAASSTHAPTVPTEGAAPPARLAQPRSASSWAAVAAGSTAPAAAGVDPVGLSSGSSQLPGTSPRPQTSSFGAAATTAASSTHAPTVPTEGAAPPARLAQPRSASSWAAVAAGSTAPAAAGVDPVGLLSGSSQLPGTSPRPQTSSFGAAATTAASSTHAPTVPTEGAAPPARLAQPRSASSWAAVAAGSTAPAAAGVDPVGLSSGSSQLPGTSPRPQTSSFGAAATTAASSTHAPTVPTEGAAPPARLAQPRSASSWAAVAAGSSAFASAGRDSLPAAPAAPEAVFDRAPGGTRPRPPAHALGYPYGPPVPPANAGYSALPTSSAYDLQFQMKGLGGSPLQETAKVTPETPSAEAGLEALKSLFRGSPQRPRQ